MHPNNIKDDLSSQGHKSYSWDELLVEILKITVKYSSFIITLKKTGYTVIYIVTKSLPNVHSHHFRSVQNFSKRPQQCPINSHELWHMTEKKHVVNQTRTSLCWQRGSLSKIDSTYVTLRGMLNRCTDSLKFHLLGVNLVCLIQNNTYFIIMATQGSNYTLKLITDVKFIRIKQEKNKVTFCCKPWCHPSEVITALSSLFLPR